MNKMIVVVIIIVLVIFLVMLQQRGLEGIKANPFLSTWDATKAIADTGKDGFDKGKEIIDNFKNDGNNEGTTTDESGTLVEVGRPLCSDDASCNTLEQCSTEEPCSCIEGSCFQ